MSTTRDRDLDLIDFDHLPAPLTVADAQPGAVITSRYERRGVLYRIEGRTGRGDADIAMTRQDGRKFKFRVAEVSNYTVTDRPFPVIPDYLPKPGDFVTTAHVRGWTATTPLIVTKLVGGKATLMALDGSGAHASVPFAHVTKADVAVTLADAMVNRHIH